MTQEEIKNIILSGCKFRYDSYDHKSAFAEYKEKYDKDPFLSSLHPQDMPQELKDKYKIERVGKLREVHFTPNGHMWRFKIGNRYSKSFYASDFGVVVHPITSPTTALQ